MVELELKVTGDQRDTFTNIVHITQGGSNGVPGDRMPLISLFPSENKLHMSSYVNGNINHSYNPPEILQLGIWTKIRIQQRLINSKYMYSVFINDKERYIVENTTPIDLHNMIVYASDPWGSTPNAKIRNFNFSTMSICKHTITIIKLGYH